MKNVYIVQTEDLEVFTTARKAIESIVGFENDYIEQGGEKRLDDFTVEEMISIINKENFITFVDGYNRVEISKKAVR